MKSCMSGPIVAYGQPPLVAGIVSDYNPDLGPSTFWGGTALFDLRMGYLPGGNYTDKIYGFIHSGTFCVLDQAPSALSAVNIAAAQVPVAATPLTLVSSSGAGITVNQTVMNPATGQNVTGLLVIDGLPGYLTFGTNASLAMYDPTKAIARNLRFTSVGNDSAATATIVGYDIYGFRMTETVTLSNATVASGKKAFKFIQSITPAGTLSGSNLSVGTGDVFGYPLRTDNFFYGRVAWNNAFITATTGYLAAVTTNPATATTGDVRGTYGVQSASDGTKRLQIFMEIPPANIGSVTGLFGVTQA